MERSGCPTKQGNRGGGEGSPCKPKSLNFRILLDKNITYWEIPQIMKKGISNSFLDKSWQKFCLQHSLHNYDLFGKARLKLSPLIQNSVQQDYIAESYGRYLLSYQKCQNIVAPTRCGQSPPPPEPLCETLGMEENPTQLLKICSFPPSEILPLIYLNLLLSKVWFLSPSNSNFQVQCTTFICSCSYFCCIIF